MNTPEQTAAPVQPPNVVPLETPITRGAQTITEVTLRKPSSGELRGVHLGELFKLDVASLIRVLPRITSPALTEADVMNLDPADLLQMGAMVSDFLLTRGMKAEALKQLASQTA
ncbi:MAG: phage tail assembly protein [Moraxellaceae bacterium]|nr:phage tail assembly protein [Moraxellaceae bacterium]